MARSRIFLLMAIPVAAAVFASASPGEERRAREVRAGGAAAGAPIREARIVREYPHDPEAFTQGLLYHDGLLYESTGLRGRSTLREVDPGTGVPRRVHRLPDDRFGEGLALLGERLVQLTWRSGVLYVYDRKTFRLLRTFPYSREGWGLASDGRRLVASDGSDRLFFLDPRTFRMLRSVAVTDGGRPVVRLNELEFAGGRILANVWESDRIARIDPASGRVVDWIDLAPLRVRLRGTAAETANGIAWDARDRRLLVTGKLWPILFEVTVDGPER
jgi:glutamine cyclotransferase